MSNDFQTLADGIRAEMAEETKIKAELDALEAARMRLRTQLEGVCKRIAQGNAVWTEHLLTGDPITLIKLRMQ